MYLILYQVHRPLYHIPYPLPSQEQSRLQSNLAQLLHYLGLRMDTLLLLDGLTEVFPFGVCMAVY